MWRRLTFFINCVYLLVVLLFLLDSLTPLDIKSQTLKSFVYIGILIATPILLIWNLSTLKSKTTSFIGVGFPSLLHILIFVAGPLKIMFSSGSWHTQTILFQNINSSNKKIELQIQDIGARGFNKRVVHVIYLTSLFMIANEVPVNLEKNAEWKRVDEEVNELGLKFP